MKKTTLLSLFVLLNISLLAQNKFTEGKQKAIEFLESKRKDFKAAQNDSLYLASNSDQGYSISTITRGDQAEDIEEQIFKAKPGEVVGPFDGEKTFYLLKILSMDSLKRTKVKSVTFFPRGEYTSDTAKFSKFVEKYIDHIKKGKEYSKMIVKDETSIGLRTKGVLSFWEGQTKKENYELVFERKANNPFVRRVGQEIQVLYVVEEKRNAAFRARVITLAKKL
jgi:hypothetical protein